MNAIARYPSHLISNSHAAPSNGFSMDSASMGWIAEGMGRFTGPGEVPTAEEDFDLLLSCGGLLEGTFCATAIVFPWRLSECFFALSSASFEISRGFFFERSRPPFFYRVWLPHPPAMRPSIFLGPWVGSSTPLHPSPRPPPPGYDRSARNLRIPRCQIAPRPGHRVS